MTDTSQDMRDELNAIKSGLHALLRRIETLERGLDSSDEPVDAKPGPAVQPARLDAQDAKPDTPPPQPRSTQTLEVAFGKFWLNKIGIGVFTLGIGFLISYTFHSFTPLLKILFGYGVACLAFGLGLRLETNRHYRNFGRALLGGGWAIVYFTTYAMHHFEPSRLIASQTLDLILLSGVALGMLWHSLFYKSENMTGVAVFAAFLTSVIGAGTEFALVSRLVLVALVALVSLRLQWPRLLTLGIFLSYVSSFYGYAYVHTDLWPVLAMTWAVFVFSIHRMEGKEFREWLPAANIFNGVAFWMASDTVLNMSTGNTRFVFLSAMAGVYAAAAFLMLRRKNMVLFHADAVFAVAAGTIAIMSHFLSDVRILILLTEMVCLIYMGARYDWRSLRYAGYVVAMLSGFQLWVSMAWHGPASWGGHWHAGDTAHLGILVFMSFSSVVVHRYLAERRTITDRVFECILSTGPVLSLMYLTDRFFHGSVKTSVYAAEALSLYAWGVIRDRRFVRMLAIIPLAVMAFRFIFIDYGARYRLEFVDWALILAQLGLLFGMVAIGRYAAAARLPLQSPVVLYTWALVMTVAAILKYVYFGWVALAFGLSGMVLMVAGFLTKDRIWRTGGLLLLGLTLLRVVFIDLAGLETIYKIVSFIVIGGLLIGVSFLYNRYFKSEG